MSGSTTVTINTNGMVLEIKLNISDKDGMDLLRDIKNYIDTTIHPSRISKHIR